MSYHEVSAIRYAMTENRSDSFALLLAPRLVRLFRRDRGPDHGSPRALDIGAGTGQLTDVLRTSGFQTIGLDRSLPMLARRTDTESGSFGPAVVGDAAAIPLAGRFELVTATFNVLNHLPSIAAVSATIREVARVLAPDGLFVFDINTRAGLTATAQVTQHQTGPDGNTTWTRQWRDENLLSLRANGLFRDGDHWHYYDETIDKIVIPTATIDHHCREVGLGPVMWSTDDLVTVIDQPEDHAVAFGIVRAPSGGSFPKQKGLP